MTRLTRSAALGVTIAALALSPAIADPHAQDPRNYPISGVTYRDLRFPDARDAAEARGTFNAPEVTVVKVPASSPAPADDGLDWSDAGIGAAGVLGLVMIAFGGGIAVVEDVKDQPNRVTVSGGASPPGRGPLRTRRGWCGGRLHQRRAHAAQPLLPPALREADDRHPSTFSEASTPRPGGASSGSATMPAVRWTINDASATAGSRRGESSVPTAPIRRSRAPLSRHPGAELERRPVVPAPPKGTSTGPAAATRTTTSATSHGACSSIGRDVSSRGRSSHDQQVDVSPVPRAARRRARARARRKPPHVWPHRRAAAARGVGRAPRSRPRCPRRRRLPRRSAPAAARRPPAAQPRPRAPRRHRSHAGRAAASVRASSRPARHLAGSSSGSWRRIACSSRLSSSLGSSPSSSDSSRCAWRYALSASACRPAGRARA